MQAAEENKGNNMVIDILITIIGIAVFLQPNTARLYVSCIYFLSVVGHDVLFSDYTGIAYYGSAALSDFLAMILISNIRPISIVSISIANICFISIIINTFGWLLWYFYQPPIVYNAAFIVIYVAAFFALLKRDNPNGRGGIFDHWNAGFYHNFVSRVLHFTKLDKKT